jgi:CheY-like chemotaxis protein
MFKAAAKAVGETVCVFEMGDDMIKAMHNPPPAPSIIFVDLNMPAKNGFDVIKDIKQSEGFKDLPIVVYSTAANQASILKSMELGASLFVTKPTSVRGIEKIIRDVVEINWENRVVTPQNFVYKP